MNTLSYSTVSANKATVQKEWVQIDATDVPLGRLATQVAMILRGKHKPNFTPHVDCGDNVIITNCEKVKLTGNKVADKKYIRHTGYPGGQRVQTASDILTKYPERLIEKAVKGMLPKNKLSRQVIKKLHVYVGEEHKHEAQTPTVIEIKVNK
ncbi:MAG: 50S ribosomal protein L13 [Bacteroidales bacterium]